MTSVDTHLSACAIDGPVGSMARRVRDFDWAATPLGPIDQWPAALTIAVNICLNSRFPMFVWWGPHLINIYNDAYAPMLGKRHPDALGRRAPSVWADIWPVLAPQVDAVMNHRQATWNERVRLDMERNGYPEETYFTWSYSPILADTGAVGGLFCAVTEETVRVFTERSLEEARRRLDSALIAGEVGTYEWDIPADRLRGDRNFARMFGITLDHEGSAPLADYLALIHPDDLPKTVARIRHTVDTGADYTAEYRIIAGGRTQWVLVRGKLERDPRGRPLRFLGVVLDITDRKDAAAALRVAKDEAERANAAKDHFLAVLSHELRTPLTPVLMTAQMLEHDPSLDPDLRGQIQMIRRNVELETRLIDDLLDLTRITRSKLTLHPSRIDAHEQVRHVLAICEDDIASRRLQVAIHFAAGSHHLDADPARFQQVLWNLLKNAIKFTPTGGSIALRTTNPDPATLQLDITDTGAGIAPDILPRIFNAFEQGGRDVTRQFGGLGLGLAISKALIDMHGGTLVASSPGLHKGATFTVRLPAVSAPSQPPTLSARPLHTPLGSRILLVEDHADTRRVMKRLLAALGCSVVDAGTISDALAVSRTYPFDIVISDIGLPDGRGTDLLRQLRQRGPVKAIALSGYGMEDDITQSLDAGFHRHLTKPVNLLALEETLRGLL